MVCEIGLPWQMGLLEKEGRDFFMKEKALFLISDEGQSSPGRPEFELFVKEMLTIGHF
jgi:hypothetical protein